MRLRFSTRLPNTVDRAGRRGSRSWLQAGANNTSVMMRYAAVTDQTLRAAAEAVSGAEIGGKRGRHELVERAPSAGHGYDPT